MDSLVEFGKRGAIDQFVRAFVPLDISEDDLVHYLKGLQDSKEEWINLRLEIAVCASGKSVSRIEGDQETRAVFFFPSPNKNFDFDREVIFTCTDGEWRAEG